MTAPAKKIRRAAIYVRVSTGKQNIENQEPILREVCERAGWEVVAVYKDEGISGSKGRDQRPGFDAMLKDATRRKFDVLLAFKLDRLGRSLRDLLNNVAELGQAGVDLYLHDQAVDTGTPAGKLLFHMLGAVAEFERDLTIERVHAGLDRARAQGKQLGRPRIDGETEAAIRMQLGNGTGMNKIAKQLGVGKATVQRIKKEMVQ
jgi:DNA invertase Pin-like site-specific DNA recombinase